MLSADVWVKDGCADNSCHVHYQSRVDHIKWLFNKALIQVLPHPRKADTFQIIHALWNFRSLEL